MSEQTRNTAGEDFQPESFQFSAESMALIPEILSRYPKDRSESAVMPLLDLAQRQMEGWLPRAAMDHVADILAMAPIRVYELATFYSMYNLAPIGKNHVQVCTNTSCWLRGSEALVSCCKAMLGIGFRETTEDGEFTFGEVECIGACVNAPVVKINDDYYEDLDYPRMEALLTLLKRGARTRPGSQANRKGSAPANGPTTLLDLPDRKKRTASPRRKAGS